MITPLESRPLEDDAGVSLIEVVVSLFLLAMLSIAFLPILVQGLQQSAINATRSTAVQLVNEQIELANATTPTCSNLSLLGTTPVANYTDKRNVTLATTRTVTACPSSYPGTIKLTITVKRTDTNVQLSGATTYLYVTGA